MLPRGPDLIAAAIALMEAHARFTADPPRVAVEIRHRGEIHERPTAETVAWLGVTNPRRGSTEEVLLQLDIWAATYAKVLEIEAAIRAVLDRGTCYDVDGLRIASWYDDGRDLPDSEPGSTHRAVDYHLEAAVKFS